MRVLVLQLGSLCRCWLQHVRMCRLDYVLVTGLSSLGCLVNLSCLDPTYILCY